MSNCRTQNQQSLFYLFIYFLVYSCCPLTSWFYPQQAHPKFIINKVIQCFCERKKKELFQFIQLTGGISLRLPLFLPLPPPPPSSVSIQTEAPTQKRCHTLSNHQSDRVFIIFLDHINLNKRLQTPLTFPPSLPPPPAAAAALIRLHVSGSSEPTSSSLPAAGKVRRPGRFLPRLPFSLSGSDQPSSTVASGPDVCPTTCVRRRFPTALSAAQT